MLDFAHLVLLVFLCVQLVRWLRSRNLPRIGGKLGPHVPAPDLPAGDGFARVDCREITIFTGPPDGTRYPDLKTYLRDGVVPRLRLMRVFQVARCRTRIEIPVEVPDYPRLDAA